MASKIIYMTELLEDLQFGLEPVDLDSEVSLPSAVSVVRYADQRKYLQVNNTGSSMFSFGTGYRCAYTTPFVNPVATINSIDVTMIKAQTYIGVGAHPFYGTLTIGAQSDATIIFPVNTVASANPPDVWETHTVNLATDMFFRDWDTGQLKNGITLSFYTFGDGSTAINFIDQVYITVNYTEPVPTLGTPVLEQAWMNHLEVYTPITLNSSAVTSDYPLTYSYEWTTQNPNLATPTITSTSTPVVMTNSQNRELGDPRVTYFAATTVTIPDNFAFNDSNTYLATNKTYWVRFIVTYAGITYRSSWVELTTASVDRIGI